MDEDSSTEQKTLESFKGYTHGATSCQEPQSPERLNVAAQWPFECSSRMQRRMGGGRQREHLLLVLEHELC